MKRAMDSLGASAGLVLLSPALLGVAPLIRWRMGAPILFRQIRPGLRGRPLALSHKSREGFIL